MSKLNAIVEFSIVLNRGYGTKDDCEYFAKFDHPKLITEFINYVNLHKDLLGITHIENRQSIADSGCDVFIEIKGKAKIGVQIKSPNDLTKDDFAMKVKAQYSETSVLKLDKYYLLICCPMSSTNEKKVNYIVSHLATYNTNYHAVLNPHNCIKIFNPGGVIPIGEFNQQKQFYSEEENISNIEKLLLTLKEEVNLKKELRTDFDQSVKSALSRPGFQAITSAKKFIDFLQLDQKVKPSDILGSINDFIQRLGKLSDELKSFYFLIITEAVDAENYVDALEMNLPELQSLLKVNKAEVRNKIEILLSAKYKLIRHDEDVPNFIKIFIWLPGDYNFMKELKLFCEENNLELKKILLEGEFALLD
jgi:hypothetical protein